MYCVSVLSFVHGIVVLSICVNWAATFITFQRKGGGMAQTHVVLNLS